MKSEVPFGRAPSPSPLAVARARHGQALPLPPGRGNNTRDGRRHYISRQYFLTTKVALWPPKPKELERATLIFLGRALLGT